MKKNSLARSLLFVVPLLLSTSTQAGFYVGATRLVYNESAKNTHVKVGNKSTKDIYLIQSWIEPDSSTVASTKSFVITPPLFRLNEKEDNALRVVFVGNKSELPQDRESLFWVNIKAIPAQKKSDEHKNLLSFAFNNKIKLFYRPQGLTLNPDEAYQKLSLTKSGSELVISNPTPYHMTLSQLNSGNQPLIKEPLMIAPKQQKVLPISSKMTSVVWETITDYGGRTPKQITQL